VCEYTLLIYSQMDSHGSILCNGSMKWYNTNVNNEKGLWHFQDEKSMRNCYIFHKRFSISWFLPFSYSTLIRSIVKVSFEFHRYRGEMVSSIQGSQGNSYLVVIFHDGLVACNSPPSKINGIDILFRLSVRIAKKLQLLSVISLDVRFRCFTLSREAQTHIRVNENFENQIGFGRLT